jgi:hypothetical protein
MGWLAIGVIIMYKILVRNPEGKSALEAHRGKIEKQR